MSSVRLSKYECINGLLPDVCIICGEPASTRVRRRFSWFPRWTWLLMLVNPVVFIFAALLLTNRMAVQLPVCQAHAGYWRSKLRFVDVGAVVMAVNAACLIGCLLGLDPKQVERLFGWI